MSDLNRESEKFWRGDGWKPATPTPDEALDDALWKLEVDAVGFLRGMGRYAEADANSERLKLVNRAITDLREQYAQAFDAAQQNADALVEANEQSATLTTKLARLQEQLRAADALVESASIYAPPEGSDEGLGEALAAYRSIRSEEGRE